MKLCATCDDTDWVTVKVRCESPDTCVEGAPIDGFHDLDVKCPCCAGGDWDGDGDEGDDDEGEEEDEEI